MLHDLNDSSPHSTVQREAIAAGVRLLHDEGRARARFTMACGTGKTFTQLKLVEALLAASSPGPQRILVLVPTLALVRQSRDEWAQAQALGEAYASLCVCSDPSLKAGVLQDQGEDHVELTAEELAELGVPPDTNAHSDIQRINAWLDQREQRTALAGGRTAVSVIFSTYQSAPVVGLALAARSAAGRGIDIGVFDEAHKTAGAAGKPFAWALADENIEIGKRLFFTATERIVATAKRGQASEDGEIDIISMDDEAVYGPRAYNLPFSQAVERGIIVPYEIIISVVGDPFLQGEKLAQRRVRSAEGEHHSAIDIANMTALQRVMEKFQLRKAITFHRTVARAKGFAGLRHTVEGARMDGSNGFNRLHVSGRQTHAQRSEQLRQYAEGMGRQIITNARCLTEGINVPATDLVAFMDSRGSTVDIVQAAGRTMRRAPGKTKGYIFLPVHDIEQDFGRARDVLAALAENDEALQAEMRRVALEGGPSGTGGDLGSLPIQILTDGQGGEVKAEQLVKSIRIRLLKLLSHLGDGAFEKRLAQLKDYVVKNGNSNVPSSYLTDDNFNLGAWVRRQRWLSSKVDYPSERREKLRALGVLVRGCSVWDERFGELVEFKKEFGSCEVPQLFRNQKLARWVFMQRKFAKDGRLSEEKKKKLTELGLIFDDLRQHHWRDSYNKYANYFNAGISPGALKVIDREMWEWRRRQRTLFLNGKLDEEKSNLLKTVGFGERLKEPTTTKSKSDADDALWDSRLSEVVKFFREKGRFPKTREGMIGQWLARNRTLGGRGLLSESRKKRLIDAGISFVKDEVINFRSP